jgi:hypothetical protein
LFCAIAIVKSFQPTAYQTVDAEKLFENVFCRINILARFGRFRQFWSISATDRYRNLNIKINGVTIGDNSSSMIYNSISSDTAGRNISEFLPSGDP